MNSIIEITPKPLPVQMATVIQISLLDYQLFDKTVKVMVHLYDDSNTILNTVYVTVGEDVTGTWGVDDTVIENHVLQELGMTRKPGTL